jgi:cytochrome c oxidase subunit III
VIAVALFLAVIAAITGWWLSRQRLTAKPWLEANSVGDVPLAGTSPVPAAKVGLGVLLAVISCLFALFISAYLMRMDAADWRPLPAPKLLWFNTGVLILSSVALHAAHVAAGRGQMDGVRAGLLAGGASAVIFLIGQLLAWRQLVEEGYFVAGNPANAFFYLITAVHGVHVLGGLAALSRTAVKAWDDVRLEALRSSVALCATYWHFLLVVWLVLFALLTHWADGFSAMCRALLS